MVAAKSTIVAVATPIGVGGVGVVRISGALASEMATQILGKSLKPRVAYFSAFKSGTGETIDEGIAVFFKGPQSFTGEDILELQGHGGFVVMDALLERTLELGGRLAEPGEFSQRAFLNGKIDLAQAESIADLIEAGSRQSAKMALCSLQGVFSDKVRSLQKSVTDLRVYIEAAIDFPEEEIDFLSVPEVGQRFEQVDKNIHELVAQTEVNVQFQEGRNILVAGRPNAGKSSLLNALSGEEVAIVTPIAGTTRDVLKASLVISGIPCNIIDTAGLRQSNDLVELEGIERAKKEAKKADHILWVADASQENYETRSDILSLCGLDETDVTPITLVKNKVDLVNEKPNVIKKSGWTEVSLSAKYSQGLNGLKEHLKDAFGVAINEGGLFSARRRHLDALNLASKAFLMARSHLDKGDGDLVAEELRLMQNHLGTITGTFTPDDLLGEIFSSFCIGK